MTSSSVTLSASPNPANYGQSVTLTAAVTPGSTGKVTFYDGTTVLGVGTISGTQATLTTVMLPSGTRQLRAYYSGDAVYAAGSSPTVSQTVVAGASNTFRKAVIYDSPLLWAIAVGDFNGDGRQDFAATDGAVLFVYLGKGDGTFQPGVGYSAGSASTGLAAADCNGDGRTDLIAASMDRVNVLLGNGDGTFQTPVAYPTGPIGQGVAAGDFNGDGNVDLVTGGDSYACVLLGNGDGTFRTAVTYSVPEGILSVAVGDFNGDGKADIAAGTWRGVSLLLGNGDGTFGTAVAHPITTNEYAVVVQDFNRDGKADVATGTMSGLFDLLGNGAGGLGAATTINPDSIDFLAAADFDGDGNIDLVMTPAAGGQVGVFYGKGDGTFRTPIYYPVSSNSGAIAIGDFNGDGKADLIVTGFVHWSVLLGGGITDLAMAVSRDGGFTQGQNGAVYTVTVSNAGDFASSGPVTVAMTLPAGFAATSLSGAGWNCTLATLTCTRTDSLAPGGAYPITLKMNVASGLTGNVTSTFTVSGGGDQNTANNAAADTTFVRFPTATNVSSTPNPAVLGHPVTLTATVTAGATGSVAFYDGITILGTATLANGQATFTTSLLPSGSRKLQAHYLGDSVYGPSISATQAEVVSAASVNGLSIPVSYKVDTAPTVVVSGDFNGDGHQDLVTLNNGNSNGSISVLLGNGDGTYRPAVTYVVFGPFDYPDSAVVADFNRDGKADLAVAIGSAIGISPGIFVLLGNGDGTFQSPRLVSPGVAYRFLGLADFDGDGKQDLVAVNGSPAIFLGNGDGTFQSPLSVNPGFSGSSVAVADMNVDGIPDLVFCCAGTTAGVAVLLGRGDGTFQSPINSPQSLSVGGAIAVGDLNGDGLPDVALIDSLGIVVQLGNGDGSLRNAGQLRVFSPGYAAVIADFNGDGKADLAEMRNSNSQIYLAFGNGDGTLSPGLAVFTDPNPSWILPGDLNGDGKPDFVTANPESNEISVFFGAQVSGLNVFVTHSGRFTAGSTGRYQITVENPLFAAGGGVTVTDTLPPGLTATAIGGSGWSCTLNTLSCTTQNAVRTAESYPPITLTVSVSGSLPASTISNQASVSNGGVINTATDPTVIVLPTVTSLAASPNPSTLGKPVTLTATVTAGATGAVTFFDGNAPIGTADIAGWQATLITPLWSSGTRSLMATYRGDAAHAGSSSAARAQTVSSLAEGGLGPISGYATGTTPWSVAAADFNGDGKIDLVTANAGANTVSVLLGNGNGTFRAKSDFGAGIRPVAVVAGDWNNDGKTDLAIANQNGNNVGILLGNGDGTFQPAVNYATGNGPIYLAVGDLNGDGYPDLVTGNTDGNSLTLLFGRGDGTFQAAAAALPAWRVAGLAICDVNHDGKADIIYMATSINVLLGNGDGTFSGAISTVADRSTVLTVADLNGDGFPDVVTGDLWYGVDVFLGNGDGTFRPYVHYNGGFQPMTVICADVDGDGKLDVVSADSGGNSISVWFGNGKGTLQTAIAYTVGLNPRSVVASDFNGDGSTDLAVANSQSNTVSTLLGIVIPVLSIGSSHTGPFLQGQTGATYSLTVFNNGPGATSGTVTVTDTLPAGLTATGIAGAGWNCTLANLTCTRSDSLAAHASFPVITVTVDIAVDAAASVTNLVSVSGGGGTTAGGSDVTAIASALITVQTNPPGLTFRIDGSLPLKAPQVVGLTSGSHAIAVSTLESGTAGTQYLFANWSDGGSAAHIITVGSDPATYTASFKTQYQLTVAAAPFFGGTVTQGGFFDAGTLAPISATANEGWSFSFWSGDMTTAASSQAVLMNGPRSVTANFSSPCFAFSATSASLPATGTSVPAKCPDASQATCGFYPEHPLTLTVTPGSACGTWRASSSDPTFLQVVSGITGSGVGTIGLSVLTNVHTGPRNAVVTVSTGGASAAFLVTEAGSSDNLTYREVYALYEQLLGRDPDQGGFTFWTGSGVAGLGQMADSFLTSPEAFGSDFAVMAAYQAALGTPPTYSQFSDALAQVRTGAQTVGGLFATLAGGGYTVANLYQNLLGRSPQSGEIASANAAGLASWFQTLIGYPSGSSIGAANNEFQSTGTFHVDHTNALYARMLYYVILNRDPDPTGLAFWLGVANSGGPGLLFQGWQGFAMRMQLMGDGTPTQGFIGSPEFQGLFAN